MTVFEDGMLLYHGSYAPIERIALEKCSPGKDFGRGFYVTSSQEQARKFIGVSLRKASAKGDVPFDRAHGFVSTFRYHAAPGVLVYEFAEAGRAWLQFVALNRRSALGEKLRCFLDERLVQAEIIVGKVANDATNPVITAYLNGLYGPVDDERAIATAVGLLLPDRLKDQFCFLSSRAVKCLEAVEVERYDV